MGPYKVKNYYSEFRVSFTNRMMVTPVRGAGRTYGVFVMERLLDLAAHQLGMDVAEIRRRNLIQPDEFPYTTGIIGQDFVKNILDSGNYPATLNKALKMIDYDHFRTVEQPKLRAEGKLVGIGWSCLPKGPVSVHMKGRG